MPGLVLRHLTDDQLEAYVDIVGRSREAHPFERRLTREEARTWTLSDPDFDPEGSWVAYLDGKPAGVADAIVERNRLVAGMNDGHIDLEVVPEHRGKGIEQQLLSLSLGYLRSRGIAKARARSPVTDTWKSALLEADSFKEEYRIYTLARSGRGEVAQAPVPEGYRLVRQPFEECSDSEVSRTVEIVNDSFRDHFSFAPEPVQRWINFRDCGEDIIMLTTAMSGSETVGICMSEESTAFNRERGTKTGWINILGVRPDHRRKGLARALLADGIRWILERGMDTVYIGVFVRNERALGLYRSFGFERNQESIWYARPLAPGTGLRTAEGH